MYVLKVEKIQGIANLTQRGHTVRWIAKQLGIAVMTVAGYRKVLIKNGVNVCGCGMSIIHRGRCLWRRKYEADGAPAAPKVSTKLFRAKRTARFTRPTKLPGGEILAGISEISVYHIPLLIRQGKAQ